MKLNKIMIAAAMGMIMTSTAYAADGRLNITGTIEDSACVVSTDDTNIGIPLGQVNKTAFTEDGGAVGAYTFDIALTGCPANASKVKVRFDGAAMPGTNDLLALTATGDEAQGVGVGLYEMDGTRIPLATDTQPVDLENQAATLQFKAAYVAPDVANVTPGQADSFAEFTVITE